MPDRLRRSVLRATVAIVSAPLFPLLSPGAARSAETDPKALRDEAIGLMRIADLTPPWFTSANWGNGQYSPWTDYIVGKLSEREFSHLCAQETNYCLRDVWDLRKREPRLIDWRNAPPLNWGGIHALAVRFFRTGDTIYLTKWLAVVRDFAVNRPRQLSPDQAQLLRRGNAVALLDAAMAWGGIWTAFAILAKGAGKGFPDAGSDRLAPFAPQKEALDASALELFPPQVMIDIVQGFATGDAAHLIRYYGPAGRIPNQRFYGLEALTYQLAFFPRLPDTTTVASRLSAALGDAFNRYTHRDGGQLEQSFNYNIAVMLSAERMAKLPFASAPQWEEDARLTTQGWHRMAAALATPQGGLPQVGNTVWGRVGRSQGTLQFSATSMAFPYSGYYVQRSSWAKDAGYLFFFYRRAARGHTMAGCNSIQLGAYGRQLLIAGGAPSYRKALSVFPEARSYLAEASTFKTSTVLVDGRSQHGGSLQGLSLGPAGKPDLNTVPPVPVRSRWHTSTHFDFIEGVYAEGYRGTLDEPDASLVDGISHWRQVVFARSLMLWVVVDVLRTAKAHSYTQVWKFSAPQNGLDIPGFAKEQISLSTNERTIRTTDSAPEAVNITLQHFGMADLSYRSYFGEGLFGYLGPAPLQDPLPATDVHAEWSGAGNQVLLTIIVPHRGTASPIKVALNTSGEKIAGCRLELTDGTRVSVLAAAESQSLRLGQVSVEAGDLLVMLLRKGGPERGLIISDEGSHEFDGDTRRRISIPAGFRWVTNSAGALEPSYGRRW